MSVKPPHITPRLEKVCAYIGSCHTLADIGTDHAFVPITLIMRGKCEKAYACDVGRGPLDRAAEYIKKYALTGKITPCLSDGFDSVPEDWDTAVIAGMGGELIAKILSRTVIGAEKTLVLQPMTKIPELRLFLYSAGFSITDEDIVREGGKLYSVLKVRHTPCDWNRTDIYASAALRNKNSEEKKDYFEAQIIRLRKIIDNSARSRDTSASAEAERILGIMEELIQ